MRKIYVTYVDHHYQYGELKTEFSHKIIEVPEWMINTKECLISRIEDELKKYYSDNAKCRFDILNIIEL